VTAIHGSLAKLRRAARRALADPTLALEALAQAPLLAFYHLALGTGWRPTIVPDSGAGGRTTPAPSPRALALARRLASACAAAAALAPARFTCLRQALALRTRLRGKGLAGRLILGARRGTDGCIEAHAWVELGGVALDPSADANFAPFRAAPVASPALPSLFSQETPTP